ncbi:unnamed protein product [marine sediment metagenome]|uniref:NAD/GMP synthase domain-containing protein n=1 Tax=marine sediment metagenome TaxID=412755 RepID=X1E907_9ZZZZ
MPTLKNLININPESTAQKLSEKMQGFVLSTLQKRGAVIGISGGIDSSVCLALCIKSFGAKRVVGISMPEIIFFMLAILTAFPTATMQIRLTIISPPTTGTLMGIPSL